MSGVNALKHSNQQLEGSCCKKHHRSCERHKAAEKIGIKDFEVHRTTVHLLKDQRNRVVGVKVQALKAKLSIQWESPLATSVTSLDILS